MNLNLSCPILCEGDEGYNVARRVWNGMIDRRPRWIVRPQSISDVMQAVRAARGANLPICVRGGGHSFSLIFYSLGMPSARKLLISLRAAVKCFKV